PATGRINVRSVFRVAVLFVLSSFFSITTQGQDAQPALPDGPVAKADGAPTANLDVKVTWKQLPKRFLQDQKAIWLFPVQVGKGRHLIPTLAVIGATVATIEADPHAMPYFRDHAANLDDINDVLDGPITSALVAVVPVSFLAVGYW